MDTANFGGIDISLTTRPEVVQRIETAISQRSPLDITFINPDYARRAWLDDGLRSNMNAFDLNLVDGIGVTIAARQMGIRVPQRLDTDSLAPSVFDMLERIDAGVFLFGCAPGVAERARQHMVDAHPRLRVVGVEHGYWDILAGHPGRFPEEHGVRISRAIKESAADFLLVSLPTPLQQAWVQTYRSSIPAPVVMTGGSYLDHVADNPSWPASWYPEWTTAWNLNWLYKLAREPRRLWRRYTIETAQFLVQARRANADQNA